MTFCLFRNSVRRGAAGVKRHDWRGPDARTTIAALPLERWMKKRSRRNIDPARRAAIGAERRSRTRADLLSAALDLFGQPHGRNTRIEDVCARAQISRGTFYNYYPGLEALLEALSEELTREFDAAVHAAFESLDGPVARACAAMRYYLHGALQDRRWGWAIVNTSVGRNLYSETITARVRESIQAGIDSGDFTLDSADVGRDILLGTGISATISLLHGGTPPDYPEKVARQVLLSFGASRSVVTALTTLPLEKLPRLATDSRYFRGTLGGAERASSADHRAPRATVRSLPGRRPRPPG
jgi:AcrR family transcriptional regulator